MELSSCFGGGYKAGNMAVIHATTATKRTHQTRVKPLCGQARRKSYFSVTEESTVEDVNCEKCLLTMNEPDEDDN